MTFSTPNDGVIEIIYMILDILRLRYIFFAQTYHSNMHLGVSIFMVEANPDLGDFTRFSQNRTRPGRASVDVGYV